MIWVFWISVLAVIYTYAGYPVWLYLRSRWSPRPWINREHHPTVSIIMAVHNGIPLIRRKVDHLLAVDYPDRLLDFVIVSDGSNDGTAEFLQSLAQPRLRTIICPEQRGKAAALNCAMSIAQGELLLFTDLRTWVEPNAVRRLINNFADPSVGCAAGELILRPNDRECTTTAIAGVYWRYEQWLRVCESKVDSPCGVCGCFYAIRRSLAVCLPEGLILDDMYQPLSVVRQGSRSVLDLEARVHDCLPSTPGGEFTRKVRTLAGNLQLIKLAPWILSHENRLASQFICHKLLRLAVPLFLVAALVSCCWLLPSTLYVSFLAAQLAFYSAAALRLLKVPILPRLTGLALAVCLLNAAVLVAACRFFFSKEPLWKMWRNVSVPEPVAAEVAPQHQSRAA